MSRMSPCEIIPIPPDQDDEGTVNCIDSSIDHIKIMLLISHFEKEQFLVRGDALYNFLHRCSVLGLGFRLVDSDVKNFEKILEDRINFIVVDLYYMALIGTNEDNCGNIESFWVLDPDDDLVSQGPGENELLLSAFHSMSNVDNTHDLPLFSFETNF